MEDPARSPSLPPPERRIYCNRTLNLKSIRAIGYDMDYTLIHYRIDAWEGRAYEHLRQRLGDRGLPVEGLEFDPRMFIRGLVIDRHLGNVVKTNRFGYVKHAWHGTRPMEFEDQRRTYARTLVDLAESRWVFMNTFFSLSEACMYAQLVDRLDEGRLPAGLGYSDLYERVRKTLDGAHMEGQLKAEIVRDPDRFVDLDPDLPLALRDQREAGKKLLLITNSEWPYTRAMMSYAFDRFLSGGSWRDLFDLVFVSARKPSFFTARMPAFEVLDEEGRLLPVNAVKDHGLYVGGDAALVEEKLKVSGEEILYVGDHLFVDVQVSKGVLRWRTALVLRELEGELAALQAFAPLERELDAWMDEKQAIEFQHSQVRLQIQRAQAGYGPAVEVPVDRLLERAAELKARLSAMDARLSPLARTAGEVYNPHWGPLMRAGNDKSHLARQVERYADIYMSRVSNFLHITPYAYLRSPRGSLPHDVVATRAADPE